MPIIETPCVNICVLDPATRLCRGCGRSIDEIAGWASYSEAERRRIMAQLPQRLTALEREPASPNGTS